MNELKLIGIGMQCVIIILVLMITSIFRFEYNSMYFRPTNTLLCNK